MKSKAKLSISKCLAAAGCASLASLAIGIDPALAFIVTIFSCSLAALAEAVWLHFNH